MRVLLIESDHVTRKNLENTLIRAGFTVYSTDVGSEGIELAQFYDYDLIVSEINLPDMTGFEILHLLRTQGVNTPFMVLTCVKSIENKVKAFGLGADDYMTKPFYYEELVARLQAIIRRSKGHSHSIIKMGPISIDLNKKSVEIDGQRVPLTRKEYQMMELLSLHKGTTLTKEMFLDHIYGGVDEPDLKIIDVFIFRLRKKLVPLMGGENCIETVWGRGYVLRETKTN